jgi:hypothetical protein
MSHFIEFSRRRAQGGAMTWEEAPMERLLRLFGRRPDAAAARVVNVRVDRLRYFLNAWGARHWADRV